MGDSTAASGAADVLFGDANLRLCCLKVLANDTPNNVGCRRGVSDTVSEIDGAATAAAANGGTETYCVQSGHDAIACCQVI